MSLPLLDAAPRAPVREDGRFELGSYRGAFHDVDYDKITSRLLRTVREKRWLWYCIVHDPWIVCVAVVRTGYASSAFGFVQRAGDPGFLADESRMGAAGRGLVRRRGGGTEAYFGSSREAVVRIDALGTSWSLSARFGRFEIDAECSHSSAPLGVVARVPGGLVNTTEKGIGQVLRGGLRVHGQPDLDLAGGLSGYDFTHGLLGRRTAWRWAFGLGRNYAGQPIGFNVVSGFLGSAECASFGPAGPSLLPEPSFQFDASSYQKPWRIHGEKLDLTAEVGGLHVEKKRLVLIRSDFLQAAATFRGTLDLASDVRLLGVVEDQDVTW